MTLAAPSTRNLPHSAGCGVIRKKSFEYQQEQCLRALKVAQESSELFTTALTAKLLYGSDKFDDDTLSKLMEQVSQAMEIADHYTQANSITIEDEDDMERQRDQDESIRDMNRAPRVHPVPPSA